MELEELRDSLDLNGFNRRTRDFLLAYRGDALEAARVAGLTANLLVRISQMKKDPAVRRYIDQVDALIAVQVPIGLSAIKDSLDLSGLTVKQKRLISFYQGDLLAAVESAGYAAGASPEKLKRAAHNVLRAPRVKAAIEKIDSLLCKVRTNCEPEAANQS